MVLSFITVKGCIHGHDEGILTPSFMAPEGIMTSYQTRFETNEHRRPELGHLSVRSAEKTRRAEKSVFLLDLSSNGSF